MMGKEAGVKEREILNQQMPSILEDNKNTITLVHRLYSKPGPTYEEEIID